MSTLSLFLLGLAAGQSISSVAWMVAYLRMKRQRDAYQKRYESALDRYHAVLLRDTFVQAAVVLARDGVQENVRRTTLEGADRQLHEELSKASGEDPTR